MVNLGRVTLRECFGNMGIRRKEIEGGPFKKQAGSIFGGSISIPRTPRQDGTPLCQYSPPTIHHAACRREDEEASGLGLGQLSAGSN